MVTENTILKSKVSKLEALVKYYEEQFRLAGRRQFGASCEKSEYDFGQLNIFNEAELFAGAAVPEPELVEVKRHYRKRTRLATDNLPVEIVAYELLSEERICPICGGELYTMSRVAQL